MPNSTPLTLSNEAIAKLLTSTQQNVARVYGDPTAADRDRASIDELLAAQAWTELDDRFFRDIAFGTGGMRGRTIGKVITKAEAGKPQPLDRPEFPGTGTNMLNFGNVHRAVSALGAYLIEGYPGEKLSVVIAHDTRYFSPEFAQAAAKSLNALGIDALLFPEDRSTPQLSFTTRVAGAHAGIMITASHNPPHDNGMKFYGADGGQVVEPHASGITKHFAKMAEDAGVLPALLKTVKGKGTTRTLDETADKVYQDAVASIVLEPDVTQLRADGKDVSQVEFDVVDAQGVRNPGATGELTFSVSGPGCILGLGNGDVTNSEPVQGPKHKAFEGRGLAIIQSSTTPGPISLSVSAPGLQPAGVTLTSR